MSKIYRVALIDDNSSEHTYFSLVVRLKNLPLSVIAFADPLQALELLKAMTTEEFPSAVITDIKMPLMDGFEFADKFYENFHEKHPGTLLFICSSSLRLEDVDRADQHPAVSAFVEKPFTKEKIEEYILGRLKVV